MADTITANDIATIWTGDIETDCLCVDYAIISCHPSARLAISFHFTNTSGVSDSAASPKIRIIPSNTNSHYYSGSLWGCYNNNISTCIRSRLTEVVIEVDDPDKIPLTEIIEYKVCIWATLSDDPADLASGCQDNCYDPHTAGDGLNDRIAIYKTA